MNKNVVTLLFVLFSAAAIGSSWAQTITPLQNGVPATFAITQGETLYFSIYVPPGQTALKIKVEGGTSDPEFRLKYGALPPPFDGSDGSSAIGGSEIPNPTTGTWYIAIHGQTAGTVITATYSYAPRKIAVLIHGATPADKRDSYWQQLPVLLAMEGYEVKQFKWDDTQGSLSEKSAAFALWLSYFRENFDLIAHSLGVVISRDCLRRCPSSIRSRVNKAVFICGPSYGVDLNAWKKMVVYVASGNWIGSQIRQDISPGSSYVWNLHKGGLGLKSSQVLQILGGKTYGGAITGGNSDGLVAGISARLPSFGMRVVRYNHSDAASIQDTSHQTYEFIRQFLIYGVPANQLFAGAYENFKGGGLMARCVDRYGFKITASKVYIKNSAHKYAVKKNSKSGKFATAQKWTATTAQPIAAGYYMGLKPISTYNETPRSDIRIKNGWMTVKDGLKCY